MKIDIQYYKKKHAAFSWEFYGRLPLKMVSKQEHLHDFLSTFCLPGNIMGCKTPVKTKTIKAALKYILLYPWLNVKRQCL